MDVCAESISVHTGRRINHIAAPTGAHLPGDLGYGGLVERTGYLRQDTRPVPFVSVKVRRFVHLVASRLSLAKVQGAEVLWSFDIAGATVDAYEDDRRISIWLTDAMRRRRRVIVLCAADQRDFLLWAYWLQKASDAVLERHYQMSSYLNKGSFARVVLGNNLHNGQAVAIKLIEKSNATAAEQRYMQRELDIIRSIHHPNIVTCLDIFDSSLRTRIVMEHMAGGILSDVIKQRAGKPLPEHDAREILRGVLSGLNYLHHQSIVHRDIKPDNILLSNNSYPYGPVKLSDFGLSNYMARGDCAVDNDQDRILSSAVGSPAFVAPELFEAKYGPPVDLWSVGVVLFLMLTGGSLPFSGNTSTDVMLAVKRGAIDMNPISRGGGISGNAKSLLLGLLNTNASKRLTAAQALKHPWVQAKHRTGSGLPPLPRVGQSASRKRGSVCDTHIVSTQRNEYDSRRISSDTAKSNVDHVECLASDFAIAGSKSYQLTEFGEQADEELKIERDFDNRSSDSSTSVSLGDQYADCVEQASDENCKGAIGVSDNDGTDDDEDDEVNKDDYVDDDVDTEIGAVGGKLPRVDSEQVTDHGKVDTRRRADVMRKKLSRMKTKRSRKKYNRRRSRQRSQNHSSGGR